MPIALLTDFGTRDHYVAAMKGAILSINSQAGIIDITHEIEPQNIKSAAFTLFACYRDFPAGTIFVCVIDPGVGSLRRAIIVKNEKHLFVGPDNGLFSFILAAESNVWSIENDRYFRKPVSSTFHGRDIFAPVSAHLSLDVPAGEFGPEIEDPVLIPDIEPKKTADKIFEGQIIHVDRFGNLVTNLPADMATRKFELEISGIRITERREYYSAAKSSEIFFIVGSAGFIEISINGSSAAKQLDAATGTRVIAWLK